MHRTGFEHALWHLVKEQRWDRVVAPSLIGLWCAGWVALAVAVFSPAA